MTTFRYNVIYTLQLLARKDEQLKYEEDVPIADVAAELVCMWFDDVYHPDSFVFRRSFTEEELMRLARFSAFYDERVPLLPDNIEEYMASPAWDEVVREAQQTLEDLGWDRLSLNLSHDLPLEEECPTDLPFTNRGSG